ncbi:MAG: hypothetical protein V1908_04510 [Candidatus Peregrinibacteria bacterium]
MAVELAEKQRPIDINESRGGSFLGVTDDLPDFMQGAHNFIDSVGKAWRGRFEKKEAKNLNEYLADDPELKAHVEAYRKSLFEEMDQLVQSVKEEPSLTESCQRMVNTLKINWDTIVFKLFRLIDLKNNPEMRARILKNKQAPHFEFETTLPLRTFGQSVRTRNENGVIKLSYLSILNSDELYQVTIHEFAHAYVQDMKGHTFLAGPLFEGVTEVISSELRDPQNEAYVKEKQIATMLFALDKDALMDYYVGADSIEQFAERLTKTIQSRGKTPAETEIIIDKILNLDPIFRNYEFGAKQLNFLTNRLPKKADSYTDTKNARRIIDAKNSDEQRRIIFEIVPNAQEAEDILRGLHDLQWEYYRENENFYPNLARQLEELMPKSKK